TRIVTRKHVDHAKIAIQKFCAIVDGKVAQVAIQPPLFSATVRRGVELAESVPLTRQGREPCPGVGAQNIPSKNVANRGALTNPKTSCSKSMMLLYRCAR